tara:strand:+ start:146 stop:1096 length:951 start_codon:yes stop_codon:yes gene_type:complete
MITNIKINKILITGGSGMVGRNFVECNNAQNFNIISPTSKELNLLDFDKVNAFLSKVNPDLIIHAAGRVGGIQANIRDPLLFLQENSDMGRNIVLAAKKQNIQNLINLSSSCVYPKNMDVPLEEDFILTGPLEPTNEGYAIAKIFVQKLCAYINKENLNYNFKTLIPCNLFGKYDDFNLNSGHLIPNIINKIHQAKLRNENTVTIWGDGSARREFMYVNDLIDCIYYTIENFSKMPEVMNVGVGKDYTVLDYYKMVAKGFNWEGSFDFDMTKPIGQKQKLVSINKLNLFGWKSKISLQKSIDETISYYLERSVNVL